MRRVLFFLVAITIAGMLSFLGIGSDGYLFENSSGTLIYAIAIPLDAEPKEGPRLRLVEITQASPVKITVKNIGDAVCIGSPNVIAGLSYSTLWVPEWPTHFFMQSFERVAILPGQTYSLTLDLPGIPEAALQALNNRLETIWTGYEDPEPEQDYIGFIVTIGEANKVFAFLPQGE
jgi:hypothetical protein